MDNGFGAFTYYIPPNETIYKGMDSEVFDTNHQTPSWFSQISDTAQQYGPYLHTLQTCSQMKLVNIMSHSFHNWLMDYVIDRFKHGFYAEKHDEMMNYLVPLTGIDFRLAA